MLNPHIDPLGQNFALNLLVDNDAHGMLGDIVDSSGFAVVALMGHSFLNSAHSLDVYNITLLVDSHVCGQRNNAISPIIEELINFHDHTLIIVFLISSLVLYIISLILTTKLTHTSTIDAQEVETI